jgi:hypothetical protein
LPFIFFTSGEHIFASRLGFETSFPTTGADVVGGAGAFGQRSSLERTTMVAPIEGCDLESMLLQMHRSSAGYS